MARNNPSVTLTFAGDSKQIGRATDEVGDSVDRMRDRVGRSSDAMSRSTAANVVSQTTSLGQARDSFDRTAESYEDMIRRMARAKRQMAALEKDKQLLGIISVRDVVPAAELAGDEAGNSFVRGMKNVITKIPMSGWVGAALLAAAVPAAGAIGLLAGGALVGGIGAGMAGLGLMVAARSEPIKLLFSELASDVGTEMLRISKPFQKTLIEMERDIREVFGSFAREFEQSFPDTAREMTDFSGHLKDAFLQLAPVVDPVLDAFEQILDNLGPMLPGLFQDIANALIPLAENISKNADGFANFVMLALSVIPATIEFINALINMGTWVVNTMRTMVDSTRVAIEFFVSGFRFAAETIWGWVGSVGGALGRARDEVSGRLLGMIQDFRNWPSHIANAVGDLGRVLWNAGVRLVSGLVDGIKSQFARVRDTLINLTSMMPSWKGPEEVDSKLLRGSGQLIIGSLVDGLRDKEPDVRSYLNELTGFIGGFGPDGTTRLAGDGSGQPPASPGERRIVFGSDGTPLGDAILTLVKDAMRADGADPSVLEG